MKSAPGRFASSSRATITSAASDAGRARKRSLRLARTGDATAAPPSASPSASASASPSLSPSAPSPLETNVAATLAATLASSPSPVAVAPCRSTGPVPGGTARPEPCARRRSSRARATKGFSRVTSVALSSTMVPRAAGGESDVGFSGSGTVSGTGTERATPQARTRSPLMRSLGSPKSQASAAPPMRA